MKFAVRALNSFARKCQQMSRVVAVMLEPTLQKSIDFTPLDPNAGPTGGDGDACPAPTISLTIWSPVTALFAICVRWKWTMV